MTTIFFLARSGEAIISYGTVPQSSTLLPQSSTLMVYLNTLWPTLKFPNASDRLESPRDISNEVISHMNTFKKYALGTPPPNTKTSLHHCLVVSLDRFRCFMGCSAGDRIYCVLNPQ